VEALIVQPPHLPVKGLQRLKVVGKQALAIEKLDPFEIVACLCQ
jgi:hypothetical protein